MPPDSTLLIANMLAFLGALSPTTDDIHMLVAMEVPRCTCVVKCGSNVKEGVNVSILMRLVVASRAETADVSEQIFHGQQNVQHRTLSPSPPSVF
jgi:hypothetical protein